MLTLHRSTPSIDLADRLAPYHLQSQDGYLWIASIFDRRAAAAWEAAERYAAAAAEESAWMENAAECIAEAQAEAWRSWQCFTCGDQVAGGESHYCRPF